MTYEQIEKKFKDKGYKFFKGELNINIFAVRKKINTNSFDDEIYLVYEESGKKIVKKWACTTDAGKYYLNNPINKLGTAIMVADQYPGAYKIGRHTTYKALEQIGNIAYYRDNDNDSEHDLEGKIYWSSTAKTNIHRAGENSVEVGKNSAGCIVFKRKKDFEEFLGICEKSSEKYGNKFTFTLFQDL